LLTATLEAGSLVAIAPMIKLGNGTFSYDVPLPLPTGVFLGAGDPYTFFFPMPDLFAVTGTVNVFEAVLLVQSGASELQGILLLASDVSLPAPLTLATLRAGGEFTFPAGSTGGAFSLPFGGTSLGSLGLREQLRGALRGMARVWP
jgi:hypothetical protein